jgi:hypothetical protein
MICLMLLIGVVRSSADSTAERVFVEKVKPLLDSRCVSCHGTEKQKGGLRLDSRPAALKGGDTGPAIVPGKPAQSLLVQAVMHTKSDLGMPPKEKLTTNDIALLERWIKDGAIWPAGALIASAPKLAPGERLGNAWNDPRNPIVRIFGGQRLDLWSLKPVQKPALPAVHRKGWVRSPIDRFVLAKLEQSGLQPSPEADRRALARRIYFDLTGLPPSAEEMDIFLADRSSQNYERLVDRLLDSPKYGEHSARQWLDVIRYSDSNGFDWDEYRPKAWRFRDYVIRSFNSDKPFDQFIREQLAGDEMLKGPPQNAREQDCLIATGYLRLGPQDNSAGLFNEQARARAELMSDLTETTASAFLGLTMGCCRCHDHKYDPLSQADHYRMRAFFEAVKYADDTPLDLAAEQELIKKNNAKLDAQIEPLKKQRDDITAAAKKRLQEELQGKLTAEEKALLDSPKDKRTDETKTRVAAVEKKLEVKDKDVLAALGKEQRKEYDDFGKEIAALRKKQMSLTTGLLMTDSNEKAPMTRILFQGDYKQEREPVEPGFISALDPNPSAIRKAMNPKTTGRRLTLAEWIASPENPLTARVFVNRVWQGHFGKGLVSTANDFGLAGGQPTHPELLDWLAQDFMREGWSIKKLHRLIVLSATYRQASSVDSKESPGNIFAGKGQFWKRSSSKNPNKIDSENNLLWRQNLRRLSAEQLRDALLAVSGSLNERAGGPPAWPSLPPEVLQANPAFLDDNELKVKGWYPSPPSEQHVRSIYMIQKKTVRVPFMETFDLPENSTSCPVRKESTVAPQALSLLNSPLAVEAAQAFANRVKTEAGENTPAQIEKAFQLAFQRLPDKEEHETCRALLQKRNLKELCRALLNLNEFIYVD